MSERKGGKQKREGKRTQRPIGDVERSVCAVVAIAFAFAFIAFAIIAIN